MQLNYRNIVRTVSVNLGNDHPSSRDISVIKADVYDVLTVISRKSEMVKEITDNAITTKMEQYTLPEDFFVAKEVLFYNESGQRYYVKELTEEEFERWSPDEVIETEENFEKIATDSPLTLAPYTEENFENAGYIGFYFSDKELVSLLRWKPAVNGRLKIIYVSIPDDISTIDLESEPAVHKAFREMLVSGATVKGLLRLKPQNDVELADKTLRLRMYQDMYKESLKEFSGYINRSTSTPIIKPFDFLNNPDDIIYG